MDYLKIPHTAIKIIINSSIYSLGFQNCNKNVSQSFINFCNASPFFMKTNLCPSFLRKQTLCPLFFMKANLVPPLDNTNKTQALSSYSPFLYGIEGEDKKKVFIFQQHPKFLFFSQIQSKDKKNCNCSYQLSLQPVAHIS